MACEKYLEMALEEIDGELKESRSLLLMRHLVSCESCRMYYERHSRLFDMMKEDIARDFIAVPESFSSSVMGSIEEDASQTVKIADYGASLLLSIKSRVKSLIFSPPSLYPIAALSVLLIVVFAGMRYEKAGSNDTPILTLSNAKGIKAESLKGRILKTELDRDGLGYYISRHDAKAHRPSGKSISRKANLVYASYNSANR